MDRPPIVGGLLRRRVVHLRLDEELQDVSVLLVVGPEASPTAAGGVVGGSLRAQHQAAVVEAAVHGFIHDVEPGPRLHRPPNAVLALVRLL